MSENPPPTPPSPPADLEWIKIKEELRAFDDCEPVLDKAKRLVFQHPMIPLGITATCASLALGLRAMVKGDRKQSNMMMRYRVIFQALTVAAITISGLTILRARQRAREEAKKNSS